MSLVIVGELGAGFAAARLGADCKEVIRRTLLLLVPDEPMVLTMGQWALRQLEKNEDADIRHIAYLTEQSVYSGSGRYVVVLIEHMRGVEWREV